jgi:hypothetical protein
MYRATAECSACAKVVDIGPFDSLTRAADLLPEWLLPVGPNGFRLNDLFRAPMTLCDDCMGRPLRETRAAITERAAAE